MKDWAISIACLLTAIALFSLPVFLTMYKWNDCRKVGHTAFYCFLDVAP